VKHWKKGILATTLVIGMALPAYAQTADTTNQTPVKEVVQQKWKDHQLAHKKWKLRHALSLGTHRQMYLTLLAEKYTPESVDEWQAAFEERERLVAEWKAAKDKDGKQKELREEFRKMVKDLHEQVKSGKITREQMKQKIKEWRVAHFGDKEDDSRDKEGLREFLEQFKQLHEEFDAAIESGDEAKIKAVLPKLLDEVEAVNAHIAKKLEEKKN
jgi:hypothetical protein